MPSLKMVFPRSTRLSIANGKLEGFRNKPMIQNNKIVADMNVEKKYVNSPVNNPTTCSIARKGVQDPSTITKNIYGNLFPIYNYPNVWYSSFFMGVQPNYFNG
jgi:hypothetical protein